MYCDRNFRTKKMLKDAVARGEQVGVYQVGPFGGREPTSGEVSVEGPWAPQAHTWYARVTLSGGVIVKVK